jgi:hypothetical protein
MSKILLVIFLQLILFVPFYFIWKKDCKKLGKSNLAVSLEERFIAWLFLCPIWIIIFLD